VKPRVLPDPEAVAEAAAELVENAADRAVAARGVFHLALAGGSTPRRLYAILDGDRIDWSRTEVWFGDERCVPPDDDASNFRMARLALLDRVTPAAVHRIETEAEDPAGAYEATLRSRIPGDPPRLDLVLLGMGSDGHTASLFPGDPVWRDTERLVLATVAPVEPRERISLTPRLLNAAREVVFLVTGASKAEALRRPPVVVVDPPDGTVRWLVDEAAWA
jgi:6-phosphogluconolactonase